MASRIFIIIILVILISSTLGKITTAKKPQQQSPDVGSSKDKAIKSRKVTDSTIPTDGTSTTSAATPSSASKVKKSNPKDNNAKSKDVESSKGKAIKSRKVTDSTIPTDGTSTTSTATPSSASKAKKGNPKHNNAKSKAKKAPVIRLNKVYVTKAPVFEEDSVGDSENTLNHFLFKSYNRQVTPVSSKNAKEGVVVHMKMREKNFKGMILKEQTLEVQVFLSMRWEDEQLTWTSEIAPVEKIFVDPQMVWTPDIILINTADDSSYSHLDLYKSKVHINKNGTCTWMNVVNLKATCNLDVRWFPLDKHACNLTFGSWSYPKSRMTLKFAEALNKFTSKELMSTTSGEFEVVYERQVEELRKFECCDEPYSLLSIELSLRRISSYYFIYNLLPWMFLSALFMLVFHIPPESGERMGYAITVMLSLTMYLLIVSDKVPTDAKSTPIIGLVFILIFVSNCVAMALVTWTTHMHLKKHGLVSPCLLRLRSLLLCCVRTRRPNSSRSSSRVSFATFRGIRNGSVSPESATSANSVEMTKVQIDSYSPPETRQRPGSKTKMLSKITENLPPPIYPLPVNYPLDTPGPSEEDADDYYVNWQTMARFLEMTMFYLLLVEFILAPFMCVLAVAYGTKDGINSLSVAN